ncbi:hypothetical protein [Clostridium sp. AUH-JLR23]|uniref:hypothetical protein n=1 Tax=Clostridium sp. AUH-JLR23 TaxID=1505062 RepID=UPI003562C7E9
MNFIKKFAKEISVFGLVLLIFLGLFIYRQATFKDYKTVSESRLTQMIEDKEDFVVVLGDSTDSTMVSYQDIMTTYTTKNRSTPFYYLDTSEVDNIDSYVEKTFDTNVTYPATLIIKDGKMAAKKEGYNQYYYLYDFVKENFE